MPASDAARVRTAPAFVDAALVRAVVLINGAVPLAILAWDAARGQLGVNAVNFAIRTTGMLGLIFLTLTLAVTPLRELTGWSTLIAARRRMGVYACAYITLHFVIFYAFDRGGSLASTLHEIVTRRYLQLGTIALVLMLPLAITSTDAMVSRLGARRWKALHRAAYVAGLLGGVHYLLLVKSDVRLPVAFLTVIALVLGYRAARHYLDLRARANRATTPPPPKRPKFWKGELVVTKVFDETPDVRTFRLAAPGGGPLPFDYEAGQYLNLALEIAGAPVRRSYTIASSPTRRGYCELTIKRKADGYASGHLHDTLSVGSRLKVSAPAGRFVFDRMSAKSVVLIAGGVGITPVMSMLRALTDGCWAGEIYLVFAARTRKDVIFEDELEYLRKRFSNLHVTVTLSNEPDVAWTGARGRLTEAFLAGALPAARDVPVYLCGPERMMDDTRAMLVAMGFAPDAVYTEAFVSPASAPAPTAGASALAETSDASDRLVTIRFAKSGRSAECRGAQTVLEAAEEAGVSVPFECRSGICGQCKLRLLDGAVTMDAEDALTDADRKGGRILACQAHPTRDVSVEA